MNPKNSKKANKRIATQRALRLKHGIPPDCPMATSDSMRAGRRQYGAGKGK